MSVLGSLLERVDSVLRSFAGPGGSGSQTSKQVKKKQLQCVMARGELGGRPSSAFNMKYDDINDQLLCSGIKANIHLTLATNYEVSVGYSTRVCIEREYTDETTFTIKYCTLARCAKSAWRDIRTAFCVLRWLPDERVDRRKLDPVFGILIKVGYSQADVSTIMNSIGGALGENPVEPNPLKDILYDIKVASLEVSPYLHVSYSEKEQSITITFTDAEDHAVEMLIKYDVHEKYFYWDMVYSKEFSLGDIEKKTFIGDSDEKEAVVATVSKIPSFIKQLRSDYSGRISQDPVPNLDLFTIGTHGEDLIPDLGQFVWEKLSYFSFDEKTTDAIKMYAIHCLEFKFNLRKNGDKYALNYDYETSDSVYRNVSIEYVDALTCINVIKCAIKQRVAMEADLLGLVKSSLLYEDMQITHTGENQFKIDLMPDYIFTVHVDESCEDGPYNVNVTIPLPQAKNDRARSKKQPPQQMYLLHPDQVCGWVYDWYDYCWPTLR